MTFIELLMVVTIIGILAAIAVPKFRTVKRRATATQMTGDFDVVRHAAMRFYVDSGYFPAEAEPGAMSHGLLTYLCNAAQYHSPHATGCACTI
ncbi:MAG TPA: prepilin-type N-terminal cleavage/methylation domain-containing protein, partial [Gemmatimonadaceae bacterium]|nr:prepilin-type N-terminal cleavage/methylation domain-containing protein [Gemmatimonadaceae bacterium]